MANPDGSYSELERLSAVETLKALSKPDQVTINDLVRFLEARGMWEQFAKITLGDLQRAFARNESRGKKKKRSVLAAELGQEEELANKPREKTPSDGGLSTEEVARQILPFVEGNGDVTLEDIADYTRLDRKVLRHHLGVMVKEELLERLGTGRNALYSTLG